VPTAGFSVSDYAPYTRVVDIQQETDVHVYIPYLAIPPFQDKFTNNGYVSITMVNTLTHPDSPVPSIFMNVWQCAADDMQFIAPNAYDISEVATEIEPPPELPVAQGMSQKETMLAKYESFVPGVGARMDDGRVMGETFKSLKEIISRPSLRSENLITLPASGFSTGAYGSVYQYYPVLPSNIAVRGESLNLPSVNTIDYGAPSLLDHYRAMFRFSRGSVVQKFSLATDDSEDSNASLIISNSPQSGDSTATIYGNGGNLVYETARGSKFSIFNYSPDFEVTLPWYSRLFALVNAEAYSATVSSLYNNSTSAASVGIRGVPDSSVRLAQYVSAGDDFQLSFQVGPPAIAL
jgi:hypothetical protein